MLIKFSKQIENSFVKIINTKVNSKPVTQLRWSFFCKSLLTSEANSESCHTSKIELFAKIVKKSFTIFAKSYILDVCQGSEYASEQACKVKDNLFLNQFKYQRK